MNALNSQNKKLNINLRKSYAKFFSVFMVCCFCFASCAWQQEEEYDLRPSRRYSELIEKVSSGRTYDIAFVGDSLTNLGDFENVFADKNCINLGIAGDSINDCRTRLHLLQQCGAKKIFLLIGINSFLISRESLSNNIYSYKRLLKKIREIYPYAEIYIESLLPTDPDISLFVPSNVICIFNEMLKQFSEEYGAVYIDLHSSFLSGDYIKSSFTCDGLHLTDEGYQVWYDTVADYL